MTTPNGSAPARSPRTFPNDCGLGDLDDVRAGDVVVFGGAPRLITRIEPYDPAPVGYPGELWCIAYADERGRKPWGITIPTCALLRGAA